MVGDDVDRIARAVRRALEDAQVVLVTGGLGPTSDDVTRDAVAAVAGAALVRSPELEQSLRERFAAYRYEMPETVLRQADVPVGATPLGQPGRQRPRLRVEVGEALVFALPGPPHELAAVATGGVLAEVATRSGGGRADPTLHCAGRARARSPSSSSARSPCRPASTSPTWRAAPWSACASRPSPPPSRRPTPCWPRSSPPSAGRPRRRGVRPRRRAAAGVVLQRLVAAGQTVAVAESLTGGLLGAALTELPGQQRRLPRRACSSTPPTPRRPGRRARRGAAPRRRGVERDRRGARQGARDRLGATWGVGVTGRRGTRPAGGQAGRHRPRRRGRPAGVRSATRRLPGDRQRVRLLAVTRRSTCCAGSCRGTR
jgi:nicotinamide-nucleotide amidase